MQEVDFGTRSMRRRGSGTSSRAAPAHPPPPQAARWIRGFESGRKWLRYAAILHGVGGTLMLLLWYAYGGDAQATRIVSRLVDAFVPRAGLLAAIGQCHDPSAWSLALTGVVFFTGHLMLAAAVFRGCCGGWWDYLQGGRQAAVFDLRFIDWIFWLPATFALGCGAYWVTYVEMATASHIICSRTPFNVWMYRMGSTAVTPLFSALVLALPIAVLVRIHFRITRLTPP